MLGKVKIKYGMNEKPLVNQLVDQGININDYMLVTNLQKCMNAANLLFAHGYLTNDEIESINNRIHETIVENLTARTEP